MYYEEKQSGNGRTTKVGWGYRIQNRVLRDRPKFSFPGYLGPQELWLVVHWEPTKDSSKLPDPTVPKMWPAQANTGWCATPPCPQRIFLSGSSCLGRKWDIYATCEKKFCTLRASRGDGHPYPQRELRQSEDKRSWPGPRVLGPSLGAGPYSKGKYQSGRGQTPRY